MTRRLSQLLKKSPGHPGDDRRDQRQATRTLVPRRSPHRSEKQGHATLGGTRHATFCLEGSANRLRLYFRRHLSRARQGGRSRPPVLQHRGHDAPPPGDRRRRRARRSRRSVCGSSRMACHREAGRARNITLVPLPSKLPELNPVENIWQYMRDNWLSNRIFANYNDILDHCCFNWNKLVERPWLIMSIGTRRWAHG